MLYKWKEKIEAQLENQVLAEDERAELKRLRKENKELRMGKETLKKTSVNSSGVEPLPSESFALGSARN
ncbi:hypothetical protein EUZ85_02380 [Hahella sp. KA22]|uniref:hypothetical protein n=1 Tax=Hahella sp. KA22 TaxID=1628392 RepID=UPI000FDF06E1|nr:hypothetical protein [Hahella sp. KA22]AZZ95339.1 hypothetical protein ENC22_30670 [Hahella sp. KA22]QAY52984.1 hypothetical protein EUZ85_02380 [Hahella sp. KA22]